MSYRQLLNALCETYDEWANAVTAMPLLRDPVAVICCLDVESEHVVDDFLNMFKERLDLASAGHLAVGELLNQGHLESQVRTAELGRLPVELLVHRAFERARAGPRRRSRLRRATGSRRSRS